MQTFRCILLSCFCVILLFSCQSKNSSPHLDSSSHASSLPPVEKDAPNSSYNSAFVGQTRISGMITKTPHTFKILTQELKQPWAIIPLPTNLLLITEKSRNMQIYDLEGSHVKTITGFPQVDDRGQGGLLDVALDPDFQENSIIYWSFSEPQSDGKNLTAVAKGKLNIESEKIENPQVIFRVQPAMDSSLHFGSRLVFAKDGNLFVSSGERSILEGRVQAQNMNSGLGKIFKITTDGKPAIDNPFVNQKNALPEIYSLGHRNVQSLAIHPETQDLWEAEFGPRGGDELNRIEKGKNYGWPLITYGIEYSGEPIGKPIIQQKEGLEQPVYYWDPVISPSGMCFYEGKEIPEWKNDLFIGCLSGQHIDRIQIENGKVVGEERLLENENQRFRDITYRDEKLYAVTDQGRLYVIQAQ